MTVELVPYLPKCHLLLAKRVAMFSASNCQTLSYRMSDIESSEKKRARTHSCKSDALTVCNIHMSDVGVDGGH